MTNFTRRLCAVGLIAGLGLAACMTSGCSSSADAQSALTKAGFTDITTQGWSPLSCSDDDTFSTKFTATNPRGERVSGVVCSSLLIKNATIRY